MAGSPVVSYEIDRTVYGPKFVGQPIDIRRGRSVPAIWQGSPESGRGNRDDIVNAVLSQRLLKWPPDRRGLGVSMHKNLCHWRSSVLVPVTLVLGTCRGRSSIAAGQGSRPRSQTAVAVDAYIAAAANNSSDTVIAVGTVKI